MTDALDAMTGGPAAPDRDACLALLDALAGIIAAGGWARFVRPPVVPGPAAFPDPWTPSPLGVATLARRLLAHAGVDDLRVVVADRRADAGSGRKIVPTEIELVEVGARARFDLFSIGDDDVAGTIAHEVGAALALRWQPADAPYRGVASTAIDDDARARGSIAAVYAGLGVLAINAAFQEFKAGRYQAHLGYAPVEYDVIEAGHLGVDDLGFLIAVQATARGAGVPRGLGGVQGDVVRAWCGALDGRGAALRARLGVPSSWPAAERAEPGPLAPEPDDALVIAPAARAARRVLRMPSTRAGTGFLAGMAAVGLAAIAVGAGPRVITAAMAAGALGGAAVGRSRRIERCSGCIDVLPRGAHACPRCGGEIAGMLTERADALDLD